MSTSRRFGAPSLLVFAAAATILLAACGRAGESSAGAQSPPPGTSARTSPTPAQAPSSSPSASDEGSRSTGPCPTQSLKNCFSFSQMSTYLQTVTPMVAQFFAAQYPDLPQPHNVVYVPHGQRRTGVCSANSQSYEYCPASDSIYLGQDQLWQFYRIGDAAPVVGLAHEWGHHIQTLEQLPSPRTAAQSVNFENQADCIAGAWTKYAGEQKWLEYPDDLNDIGGLLQAIGSREGPGRDHGTAAERTKAFQSGYKTGLKACNSYSAAASPVFAG